MLPSRSRRDRNRSILAEKFGQRSEALAALYLQLKFYRIRDRRYKTPIGEIDLVVQKGQLLVFVEVKARKRASDYQQASEAVNTQRISRAAEFWLMRHPSEAHRDCRFDVIFLAPGRWPVHLINAF
jgi:putative endonuclease